MEIRVGIAIKNWMEGDPSLRAKILDLGLNPLGALSAGDPSSIDPDQPEFLGSSLESALKAGLTHLICIEDWEDSLLEVLPKMLKCVTENPWSAVGLVPSKSEPLSWMEGQLFETGKEKSLLNSACFSYPLFFVQDMLTGSSQKIDGHHLYLHLLKNQVAIIDIESPASSVKTKLKKQALSFRNQLHLLVYNQVTNNRRPLHAAISLAMGVFLACSPFYGLQTGLIFLCAFLFRLNFAVAFIGSHISLPPIYGLIIALELYCGFKILDQPFHFEGEFLDVAQDHILAWSIGAGVVGGGLAVLLGFLWFLIHRSFINKKKVAWTGKMRGGYWGNRFLFYILKSFGIRSGYFLLNFIVPYFYLFAPKARRALNQYWLRVAPEKGWLQRQKEVLRHLFCFAKVLMDQVFQAQTKELSFGFKYREGEVLKKVDESKPQLLLFSHFGGWAMTWQGFERKSIASEIHVIRYQTKALNMDKLLPGIEKKKIKDIFVNPGEPLFMKIHGVMGSPGGRLALMGDRPFDHSFELKTFLGGLIPVPTTPFRLAKTYKASLCLTFCVREKIMEYSLLTRHFDMAQLTVDEAMDQYLQFLGEMVREKPHQWFNLYPFWSELPTLPNGQACLPDRYQLGKLANS